jgi:hypothetical protein
VCRCLTAFYRHHNKQSAAERGGTPEAARNVAVDRSQSGRCRCDSGSQLGELSSNKKKVCLSQGRALGGETCTKEKSGVLPLMGV